MPFPTCGIRSGEKRQTTRTGTQWLGTGRRHPRVVDPHTSAEALKLGRAEQPGLHEVVAEAAAAMALDVQYDLLFTAVH